VKFILNASSEADLEKVVANNGRFELRVSDFKTLMGREWLNDVVLNAYMYLICLYYSTKSQKKIDHIDSLIFEQVLRPGVGSSIAGELITKHQNIFEKDFIVIPVHRRHHWCLATIDVTEKSATYYDSLRGTQGGSFDTILSLLDTCHVHHYKKPFNKELWTCTDTLDDDTIPRQTNCDDCGVFVCAYAEHILAECKCEFDQGDMPGYRKSYSQASSMAQL